MAKATTSQADLTEKTIAFETIGPGLYASTAEGAPNTGVVIGDSSVMVIDPQATPVRAQRVIDRVRKITDKPIRHVVLSTYHAQRVLGASAYAPENIIASRGTYELIAERGQANYQSELGRFPERFESVDSIPGLTWPTMVFDRKLTMYRGGREVQILHLGRGHTKGDTVVWLPDEKVLFSSDLVTSQTMPYAGDAYLRDWPLTLSQLRMLGPETLLPGRGAVLTTQKDAEAAIGRTQAFLTKMFDIVEAGVQAGKPIKRTYDEALATLEPEFGDWATFETYLPFNVGRAFDEATGIADPRIWSPERDRELRRLLGQTLA